VVPTLTTTSARSPKPNNAKQGVSFYEVTYIVLECAYDTRGTFNSELFVVSRDLHIDGSGLTRPGKCVTSCHYLHRLHVYLLRRILRERQTCKICQRAKYISCIQSNRNEKELCSRKNTFCKITRTTVYHGVRTSYEGTTAFILLNRNTAKLINVTHRTSTEKLRLLSIPSSVWVVP
jgi:hypothetical protein